MNDIIQRIHEARCRHMMNAGKEPTVLYLGTKEKGRLDALLEGTIRYSAPIAPQIYEQCPVFEGMKLLTVLGDPEHLAVA